MYSSRALEERKCLGTRKDGRPCQAFAVWGDVRQRCLAHGGRRRIATGSDRPPPCACRAYDWPHRPGGGLCRWPDLPQHSSPTKQGTRTTAGEEWKRDKKLAMRFGIDPDEFRRDPVLAPALEIYSLLSRADGNQSWSTHTHAAE